MHRQHSRGIALAALDDSGVGYGASSLAGLPPGYGNLAKFNTDNEYLGEYALELLKLGGLKPRAA
jgi:hypothetical protein